MKFGKKQVLYIIIVFIAWFAIKVNWYAGMQIIETVYKTSLPFFYGAALAYIVNIVMSFYESQINKYIKPGEFFRVKRAFSMILSYLTFVIVFFWIFSIVIPDLIASLSTVTQIDTSSIKDLIKDLSHNKFVARLIKYVGGDSQISQTIIDYSQQLLKQFLAVLTSILTKVTVIASAVINVFVAFVFSLYVLGNKEQLCRQGNLLVDTYTGIYAQKIHYLVDLLNRRFRGFFVSQTIEAMILGSLTALGMFLFNLPFAAPIGVLIAFTALLPVVGAYIGVTIGFILIMTQSLSQAIFFVVFLVILQQFEGNLIYPRVVGGSIGLPAMWVLMAITIGASLKGIVGMIIAVPLAATFYQIIKDNIEKKQAIQKQKIDRS
ncbi:AI-2E family transporter [Streptococcus catagoni]|uniref:AI-2E family transporter n=1 Tax=Streptococcus catagoni TaxID=2654874 RepID=UPI00140BADEF|nr:AI-2E family transporter [Streptococcus catagoni]